MLRRLGIEHRVVHYDHDPDHGSFGLEAVEALGTDPDGTFKTLMVTLDDGRNAIGVVPVSCTLDLKAIAAAAGAKKARMTEPAEAERRSGYVVGGISPFGQKQVLETFVDEWATALDEVFCSGGRRGSRSRRSPRRLHRRPRRDVCVHRSVARLTRHCTRFVAMSHTVEITYCVP